MKIITNTNREGTLCYVQVKDILFLARITKSEALMKQYIELINNKKGDNDFVRIVQSSYINVIRNCDYIVDFKEYSSDMVSTNYLCNLLVSMNYGFGGSDTERECLDYQVDGIRDMISFKRGELGYKIPLVANGELEYQSDDSSLVLDSTIVQDCFIIRAADGSSVTLLDYYDFYLKCIDKIYNEKYPDIEVQDRDFKSYETGNIFIIKICNKKKKKQSRIGQLLTKIKKGVNKD